MFNSKVGKILNKVYDKIKSKEFLEVSRMKQSDFTRNRKMSFPKLMFFIMTNTKKSLQSALFAFGSRFKFENGTYTKQAFSKARKKINPSAFLNIFKESVEMFYKDGKYKRFKGYRVTAIDGTKLNMPCSKEMVDIYGFQGGTNEQPQALASCLYDVLNGIIIDALIYPHNANERTLALLHLKELDRIRTSKEILVMDRGYPSAQLIGGIDKLNFKYVIRCSKGFIKNLKIKGNDCIINHKFTKSDVVKIRVIKLNLNNGDEEILVTNIFSKSFVKEDFAKIYHMRWSIEEKYDDLKNKLEIENFSGTSNIAVLQEFYATMFLNNIASMMAMDCEEEIKEYCSDKKLKYQYKTNISMTISILRYRLIEMFTYKSQKKRNKILELIYNQLMTSVTPIRPNRTYERKVKHGTQKFHNNRRPL